VGPPGFKAGPAAYLSVRTVRVKEDRAREFEATTRRPSRLVRAEEPGCMLFLLGRVSPTTYALLERYESKEALDEHGHMFTSCGEGLFNPELLTAEPAAEVFAVLEPALSPMDFTYSVEPPPTHRPAASRRQSSGRTGGLVAAVPGPDRGEAAPPDPVEMESAERTVLEVPAMRSVEVIEVPQQVTRLNLSKL
jgi:quinol monooxygenase YgiN